MENNSDLNISLAHDEINENGSGSWIVTYSDLITLMLTFFVLLYSISTVEINKFREILKAIQIGFGKEVIFVEKEETFISDTNADKEIEKLDEGIIDPAIVEENRKKQLLQEIQNIIHRHRLHDNVVVSLENSKVIVRIKDRLVFNSGSTEIHNSAYPILLEIADIFKSYPEYTIDIAGHSDNVPISTSVFPSNWELSSYRATTVLRYFIGLDVDPFRMTATGYADLLPLAPNNTSDNRALNRRVEFILEKGISD